LAYGNAPYSQHRPGSVFVLILKNEPPSLEDPRLESVPAKSFSPTFSEFVSRCLEKDPSKRLPAAKLLGHRFFKTILPTETVKEVLGGLPSLPERYQQQERKMKESLEGKVRQIPNKLSVRLLNNNTNPN